MIIKTEKIKQSMATIMPGIADKAKVTVEGADLVVFVNKKMMSYNSKVAVSVPMDIESEPFGVRAKDLFNLVSKIKEEEIEFEPDVPGNKLKIKSGKLRATLIMQDTSSVSKLLAKMKFGEEKPLPANFVEAVKATAIPDNITPLRGFAVGKVGDKTLLVSTDRVRISSSVLNSDMQQCLLDDTLVSDAVEFGTPKTYSIVGPWFHFGYDDGMHFSMIRSDDSAFPFEAMGGALERAKQLAVVAKFDFPETLAPVADRVTTMGSADEGSRIQCELKIESDKMTVIAQKSTGTAEEEIPWKTPIAIESPARVWMPVKTLLTLAGKSTNCSIVDMGGTKRAVLIQNGDYTMVASCSKT